jgi:membrane-associated phospholipid phosphatase
MRIHTFVAAALMLSSRIVPAQSVGKMLVDDVKDGAGDMLAIWTSPFRASSRDWLLAGAAAGAFGLSMLADQPVSDWALRNKDSGFFNTLDPVRRGGKAYTGKTIVPPVAALYVTGIVLKNQNMRDIVTGCATSWLAQSAIRKGTYLLVGRERPDTSPDNPNRWQVPGDWSDWQEHSFPAGHFANAMSCATYWNERFNLGWWGVPIYAVAGAIGVGRLADGGHWTSDTVIGGIFGYAVGREVARRSLERSERRNDDKRHAELILTPTRGGGYFGVNVSF